jgi:hypothetical protein
MHVINRFRNVGTLLLNGRECLEYLKSPRRQVALRALRGELPPPTIDVNEGTTTSEELAFLRSLCRETDQHPGPIVEVGALFGFTTNELALAKAPAKPLIAVDYFGWNPWRLDSDQHRKLTERVLRVAAERLNVRLIAADKNEFYRSYSGAAPSLTFLDAIHTFDETVRDIEWARAAGCKTIAGHDYQAEFPGVIEAVNRHGVPEVCGSVWALRVH